MINYFTISTRQLAENSTSNLKNEHNLNDCLDAQ